MLKGAQKMANLTKLNKLLELRNNLVDEEDRIEWYDMMDAMDTEEEAFEEMEQEIRRRLDALMEKAPAEAAKYREDLDRITCE